MNLLLDTCVFLWYVNNSPDLPEELKPVLRDTSNTLYLSTASCWEICIKYGNGRLPLPEDPATYIPKQRKQHGIKPLPLDEKSALLSHTLPKIHADPFDRMLITQAMSHNMTLITPDEFIVQYPGITVWPRDMPL